MHIAHVWPNVNNMCDGMPTTVKSNKPNEKKCISERKWDKIENAAALVHCNLVCGVHSCCYSSKWTINVCFLYGITFLECCTSCANTWKLHTLMHGACPHPHLYQLVRICDFPSCVDKRCLLPLYSHFPLLFSAEKLNGWKQKTNELEKSWQQKYTIPFHMIIADFVVFEVQSSLVLQFYRRLFLCLFFILNHSGLVHFETMQIRVNLCLSLI